MKLAGNSKKRSDSQKRIIETDPDHTVVSNPKIPGNPNTKLKRFDRSKRHSYHSQTRIQNKFKKRFFKNKKIIVDKNHAKNKNRIMISTNSGRYQPRKVNSYATKPAPQRRKNLKSAHPGQRDHHGEYPYKFRKPQDEHTIEPQTDKNISEPNVFWNNDNRANFKKSILKRAPSGEIRNNRKRNLNIKTRKITSSNDPDSYHKITENEVKNIKIVDYLTNEKKLNEEKSSMFGKYDTNSMISIKQD